MAYFFRFKFAFGLLLLLSFNATAAEQSKAQTNSTAIANLELPSSDMGASVMQMALGLVFVLGVIFLLAWLMRRVTGIQGAKQHIKILSAINVGTRERAVLVEVAGEQLLLGVASGQVNLLHKITHPIVTSNSSDFSSSLQAAAVKLKQQTMTTKK
ncbi:flagellar biosynthetic protein FliO ['Osedax' symbiont bacterium Rs2_46_30_T18]|nr:flagellar biosynthetic protein FliO ['Osedax' symbiont bacterium Rs2_46_30_T18]